MRSFHKNSYTVNANGMYNSAMEYVNNGGLTTSSSYYSPESTPYYTQNSAKFGSPYSPSPAQTMPSTVSNMYTSNYSVSPTNRSRGANVNGSTPLAWPTNNFASYSVPGISPSVNSPNGTQQGSANGTGSTGTGASKFSRGLHTAFNSALQTYGAYPQSQGDRYHWVNKPIVKA